MQAQHTDVGDPWRRQPLSPVWPPPPKAWRKVRDGAFLGKEKTQEKVQFGRLHTREATVTAEASFS